MIFIILFLLAMGNYKLDCGQWNTRVKSAIFWEGHKNIKLRFYCKNFRNILDYCCVINSTRIFEAIAEDPERDPYEILTSEINFNLYVKVVKYPKELPKIPLHYKHFTINAFLHYITGYMLLRGIFIDSYHPLIMAAFDPFWECLKIEWI